MRKLIASLIIFGMMASDVLAAVNATANWYVRAGGSELNGGGFDSGIGTCGTNYADADASILNITDGATSGAGATTLTSAAAGFTAAMKCNGIRISAGTNFQTGYYFITAVADASNVTLDRTPTSGGAGSGGTGRVAGAHASLVNYSNGGAGLPTPALTSPLIPGNTINLRGAGNNDPTTVDYDYSAGYWTFPAGDSTNGPVYLKGYNGRPLIGTHGLLFYAIVNWVFEHIKIKQTVATYTGYGSINGSGSTIKDIILDIAGVDGIGVTAGIVINSEFRNSGSAVAGTAGNAALVLSGNLNIGYINLIYGNYIHGWRAEGIVDLAGGGTMGSISNNIIVGNHLDGIKLSQSSYGAKIFNNTIDSNSGDGIELASSSMIEFNSVFNNIISNNGAYGLNLSPNTTAVNDRLAKQQFYDYNDYYLNTTAAYNKISAGANDLTLDPQFTNAAGADYSIGTNLKAKGFSGAFPGTSSTGYTDMGAVQRQEPASSGGGTKGFIYFQ